MGDELKAAIGRLKAHGWSSTASVFEDELARERAAREKAEAERDEALEDRAETKVALDKLERLHAGESRQRKQAEARLEQVERAREVLATVGMGVAEHKAIGLLRRLFALDIQPPHGRLISDDEAAIVNTAVDKALGREEVRKRLGEAALLERGEG
jgi:hypothetical protein